MQSLSIKEIVKLIQNQKTFEAVAEDGSFEIKVGGYVPYICTAIHDGHNLRSSLKEKILIDEFGRWYEEDPFTADFIASMPITLVGLDSRFEYDLNRSPESCIYEEAWGNKVWKKNLSNKERQTSLQKHKNYYKVTHALVQKLEELYDGCVVYDVHSYNWQRWDRKVPLFNIGCERIDSKFQEVVDHWNEELDQIVVKGIDSGSAINDVFFGRGYNLEYITKNFDKTLVLATEVKKVYCDESTGVEYPKVAKELQHKMKKAILNNANFFSQYHTNWKHKKAIHLLDKQIDPAISKVDKGLYSLLKNFELLAFVNPINTRTEFNRFERNKYAVLPKFKYAPIQINPFELKQEISRLRTQDIIDVSIRHMYESVINSYFDKIDLLGSLDSKKFLYNSLRYFGRPSKNDLRNAQYLLHLPPHPQEPKRGPSIGADKAMEDFAEALENYGIKCKIETNRKVISQVMVLNSKKTILFRPDAKFTRSQINALIEHEIGVHMVTTMNSNAEKLKIFSLGMPKNTMTQEGLALLSEYMSGNLSIRRMRRIAHRVIVTDMMCSGADFIECFNYLRDQGIAPNDAFTVVTRIFRGGGFTKDFLYLRGFVKLYKFWNDGNDLTPLLVGKTSLEFYDTIWEMIDRKMVEKPKFKTQSFQNEPEVYENEIYDYILSGLK